MKIGLWYTANGFGIALGGLLGFGIGNIKGKLASWKYEFLIIGALCCIWGIVMFFVSKPSQTWMSAPDIDDVSSSPIAQSL